MKDRAPQMVYAQASESTGTNLVRELFMRNLWMSGLAMLKYIPRWFRVKQIDGMAFFADAKREEFLNRVPRIAPDNRRQWGTMNDESYFSSRMLSRRILIDWFPEQPVGLRLPKGFKIPSGAAFNCDFEKQQPP